MGSQISSPSHTSDSTTTPTDAQAMPRVSGRKRRRSGKGSEQPSSSSTQDKTSTEESSTAQRSSKRRRIMSSLSPLAAPLNKLWNGMNKKLNLGIVKHFYLNFLEMATEKSRKGELQNETEIQKSLVTILSLFQEDDQDVFRRAWKALSICTYCEQRPGQLPARADPLEEDAVIVTMVMEKCIDNADIQKLGLLAFRVIACGGVGFSQIIENATHFRALYRAGVMKVVLHAMRRHPDVKTICCYSFVVIGMMLKHLGEQARQEFFRLDGVPVFVEITNRWLTNTIVVLPALFAFYRLCEQSVPQSLVDAGVVTILESCITLHADDSSVVELVLGTLSQMSQASNPSPFAARPSLMPALLMLMEKHDKSDRIQFYAMVIIHYLGNIHPLPLQPTVDRVLGAMRRFPDTPGILFFACALLHLLLVHDNEQKDALTAISTLGGLELVANAVRSHRDAHGLAPIAHLIFLHVWVSEPPENAAANQAFGGSASFINRITGLHVNDEAQQNAVVARQNANGDNN